MQDTINSLSNITVHPLFCIIKSTSKSGNNKCRWSDCQGW